MAVVGETLGVVVVVAVIAAEVVGGGGAVVVDFVSVLDPQPARVRITTAVATKTMFLMLFTELHCYHGDSGGKDCRGKADPKCLGAILSRLEWPAGSQTALVGIAYYPRSSVPLDEWKRWAKQIAELKEQLSALEALFVFKSAASAA